jgi:hypothetical protein
MLDAIDYRADAGRFMDQSRTTASIDQPGFNLINRWGAGASGFAPKTKKNAKS